MVDGRGLGKMLRINAGKGRYSKRHPNDPDTDALHSTNNQHIESRHVGVEPRTLSNQSKPKGYNRN